jgi:pimeloyl-ACP methyl ester carboxylesterase
MKTKHFVKYQSANVGGINVFYREAGDPANPAIVLLHGFPSSSHMFRGLIEELKDEFYLIAPDYPGFGFSDAPNIGQFEYTFDNLSKVVTELLEAKGILHYWLYLQDYGPTDSKRQCLHGRGERIIGGRGDALLAKPQS